MPAAAERGYLEQAIRPGAAAPRIARVGADFAAHRIVEAQDRTHGQSHRFVLSPVHAEVDVELDAICRDHLQASEVLSAPSQFNLEPAAAQPGRHMIDRRAERILVGVGGEQVDVLGGTADHPVRLDPTGSRTFSVAAGTGANKGPRARSD